MRGIDWSRNDARFYLPFSIPLLLIKDSSCESFIFFATVFFSCVGDGFLFSKHIPTARQISNWSGRILTSILIHVSYLNARATALPLLFIAYIMLNVNPFIHKKQQAALNRFKRILQFAFWQIS